MYESEKWNDEVANKPKLHIYTNIKNNMTVEEYV